MPLTTLQADYNEATGDGLVIGQVTAAIHQEAATVYTEQPSTTIAAASNGAALPQATINVTSTTNWPSSGTATVTLTNGSTTTVAYTGITATTLTGCTGGSGTLQTNQGIIANTVFNHAARAAFATKVANGQVNVSSLILSAVAFATLNSASTDTTVTNAVATLWNQWAGA